MYYVVCVDLATYNDNGGNFNISRNNDRRKSLTQQIKYDQLDQSFLKNPKMV